MLRAIAAFPAVLPLPGAEQKVQVVSADDVAETVARCLMPQAPAKVTWELVHPHVYRLGELALALRQWQGLPPARVIALPAFVREFIAVVADFVGWLGWRSPARSTAMAQLAAGVVDDPAPWVAATGISPQSLTDILATRSANVQDRWFARLYLIKPIAIAGVALYWAAAGLTDLMAWPLRGKALELIASLPWALAAVIGAGIAFIELALGLALCVRATARTALFAGIAVLAFTEALDVALSSQALLDLTTRIVFNGPLVLATLFTLAILDDR